MEERVCYFETHSCWVTPMRFDFYWRVAVDASVFTFPPFKFHKRSSHCTLNTSSRRCNIERRKAMERVSHRCHQGCDRPVKVDVKKGTDMLSSERQIHFHLLSSLGKSRDPRLPKPRLRLSESKPFISLSCRSNKCLILSVRSFWSAASSSSICGRKTRHQRREAVGCDCIYFYISCMQRWESVRMWGSEANKVSKAFNCLNEPTAFLLKTCRSACSVGGCRTPGSPLRDWTSGTCGCNEHCNL